MNKYSDSKEIEAVAKLAVIIDTPRASNNFEAEILAAVTCLGACLSLLRKQGKSKEEILYLVTEMTSDFPMESCPVPIPVPVSKAIN